MPEVVVIDNSANVARAIFSPQMIDASGNITRAAFSLRHNENYISVCLMNVMSWMDDVKSIPSLPLASRPSTLDFKGIRSIDI